MEKIKVTRYKYIKTTDTVHVEDMYIYKEPDCKGYSSIDNVKPEWKKAFWKKDNDGMYYRWACEYASGGNFYYNVPAEEGEMCRGVFWLSERNDKKARIIIDEFLKTTEKSNKEVISRKELG